MGPLELSGQEDADVPVSTQIQEGQEEAYMTGFQKYVLACGRRKEALSESMACSVMVVRRLMEQIHQGEQNLCA